MQTEKYHTQNFRTRAGLTIYLPDKQTPYGITPYNTKILRQSVLALYASVLKECQTNSAVPITSIWFVPVTKWKPMFILRSNCIFSLILNYRNKTCNKISMTSLLIKKNINSFVLTAAADHVSDRPPRTKKTCVVLLQEKNLHK